MSSQTTNGSFVSCIMPTYNRRAFVPHAIRYFLRQDYPFKELIIIDDGTDNVADLIPDDPRIRYFSLERKITLGAKLNMACCYSKGNIIVNWDDDDWYAPGRLTYQVREMEDTGVKVCGINTLLYFDVVRKTGFQYVYPRDQRVWLLGSSLCYKKEHWQRQKFVENDVGMDGMFVWATPPQEVKVLEDFTFSVHMIHGHNVSPKRTNEGWWHPYPVEELQGIIKEDWSVYSNGMLFKGTAGPVGKGRTQVGPEGKVQAVPEGRTQAGKLIDTAKRGIPPVRNVFACLVHENEDCIIDLVRNLHYHDPESVILLYNGSGDGGLLRDRSLLERFGAVVHPSPRPAKHGYLHDFALLSMQFALENFSFDTFTIVDSDQLMVRSGYSGYLADFLHDHPETGMLSSAPAKVSADNKTNFVALQAFKEYDLWKPFLESFPGGEDKFVHWTFWPSTVFTVKAVADLLKLFRENEDLKRIISQTKIWATEEVILPTLVRLLGYEIALNPCNYDFVKYKVSFAIKDMVAAMNHPAAYWVHPVERRYENALRKYIRQQFDHYVRGGTGGENEGTGRAGNETPHKKENVMSGEAGPLFLYKKIQKINGWLEEKEADLLMAALFKACIKFPEGHAVVEVGSYEGKMTVLLGSLIKEFFPGVKMISIDPHDGKLGASDQGLISVTPSLKQLTNNVQSAGLSEVVEIIQDHACHVKRETPISFLIIDGLHDYPNVARDFRQFSPSVVSGGTIVFHDYADYYPGVQAFVNELLATTAYRKNGKADSLIILQKI